MITIKKVIIFLALCLIPQLSFCNDSAADRLAPIKQFFVGAVSGGVAMVMYAPWNYFQNRTIQEKVIEWKKPLHWFRGLPALALGKAPTIATQMASYSIIINEIKQRYGHDLSAAQLLTAATIAGGISGPVGNITQLIALHQQNSGRSFFQIISSFPRGYYDLTRATIPAMQREMIFTNTYLQLLPRVTELVKKHVDNPIIASLISGPACGAIVALGTQPLQVIITMLHQDIERKKYRGMWDVIVHMHKTGSIKNFYAGSLYRSTGVTLALPVLAYVNKKLDGCIKTDVDA